ncbi:hypothetical protein [Sphingobacterium kyonggiense]|nr:hypothetical protein [Sphingobacterium mizutaii]
MKILFALIFCFLITSCKDKDLPSVFGTCNFSQTTKTFKVEKKSGTLHYSKTINGKGFDNFKYFIVINGMLPMIVCNIPESINLEKNGQKEVVFSGNVVELPKNMDAGSTFIELSYFSFGEEIFN